jgi:hypothetical protein
MVGGVAAPGAAGRPDVPLPPDRMPLMRAGRPLKAWRWVGVFDPELLLVAATARVGPARLAWWAVWDREARVLRERRYRRTGPVDVASTNSSLSHVRVRADDVAIDLGLEEGDGVETVSPHGRSYIWTRKQAGIRVSATVHVDGRELQVEGPFGFVDDSAGYHARHTRWRWSAGVGRARGGRSVAWNLVEGVHDGPGASERTVWVDGEPHEVEPVRFAADLSAVGDLRFTEWSAREDRTNRLLLRSDYRQPFGSFSGALPGGLELESGYGVMEWHDARW